MKFIEEHIQKDKEILADPSTSEPMRHHIEEELHELEVYEEHHHDEIVEPNEGKINDWHTRHEDKHLEIYCDNHPDAFECRVYDD